MCDEVILQRRQGRFGIAGRKCGDGFFGPLRMGINALTRRVGRYRGETTSWQALPNQRIFNPRTITQIPLITWIGHATFLVQIAGVTFLVDPVFSAIPLHARLIEPALSIEKLPPIDCVLISHNHRDHLEEAAIRKITQSNKQCALFVPWGDEQWLKRRGCPNAVGWWWHETRVIDSPFGEKIKVTFVPAAHWSRRGLFDMNRSLWGGWLIQTAQHTVYIVGDSAYDSHFYSIAQSHGPIDTAIIPIGPSEPHERLKHSHLSAEEAGQAFLDLGAQRFIPAHWGTFLFGNEHPLASLNRLTAWWGQKNPKGILSVLKVGESVECVPTAERASLVLPADQRIESSATV